MITFVNPVGLKLDFQGNKISGTYLSIEGSGPNGSWFRTKLRSVTVFRGTQPRLVFPVTGLPQWWATVVY